MANYNDGTVYRGGYTITLATHGGTFVVDTSKCTFPMKEVVQTDENDNPSGAIYSDDWINGTASIQISSGAARGDLRGDTFATDVFDGVSRTYVITAVDSNNAKGALVTYDITFKEVRGL